MKRDSGEPDSKFIKFLKTCFSLLRRMFQYGPVPTLSRQLFYRPTPRGRLQQCEVYSQYGPLDSVGTAAIVAWVRMGFLFKSSWKEVSGVTKVKKPECVEHYLRVLHARLHGVVQSPDCLLSRCCMNCEATYPEPVHFSSFFSKIHCKMWHAFIVSRNISLTSLRTLEKYQWVVMMLLIVYFSPVFLRSKYFP